MKKMISSLMAVALLLTAFPAFMACSEIEPDEESGNVTPEHPDTPDQPDQPDRPEKPDIDIPQDLIEKIHAIYDNASIGPQEVRTVNRLAILTSICASEAYTGHGPITVTPALLNQEEVLLITLGGTEDVEGQATTLKESQLASFGKPNDYLAAVLKLFQNGTIPEGRPVVITGISLGGMIAQQMLSQEEILQRNPVRAIITFGSPLTLPLDRKGVKIVRFADVNDKVPVLGESMLRNGMVTTGQMSKEELIRLLDELDQKERIQRTSKYTGMIETHALSYIEDPCWNDVDFLGDPEKKNVLELKAEMKFYAAPKLK